MSRQSHRSARRAARRKRPTPFQRAVAPLAAAMRPADLPHLGLLALLMAAVLVYAATIPASTFDFLVDRQDSRSVFRNLYGLERNAAGAYRWSKPEASLLLPVERPGNYRVALTLSAPASAAGERPLTFYINGAAVATVIPRDAPQAFAVEYAVGARRWARAGGDRLAIEWQVAPYVPPGDPRALGVALYRVEAAPVGAGLPPLLPLLAPPLLLLAIAYAACRAGGLAPRGAALALGAALLGFGGYALAERGGALFWAYQPLAQPGGFLVVALGLILVPPFVRAAASAAPLAPAPGAALLVERERAFWSRASWPLIPTLIVAGGLRLLYYDRLNLWFDEGATILFAEQPWRKVLGLQGAYDFHPPLYYSTVKLVTLLIPPLHAGRLLSVAMGALTVAALYGLAARLLGRRAAILAALALAVAPLHIWFSQEARMYAPSVLLIALSYLAMVAYAQAPSWRGRAGLAALYGASVLLAMYYVYSSLYALLPQAALFAYLGWRLRHRLLPLVAAGLVAIVGYLPWVPKIFSSVAQLDDRSAMLGPTPARVQESLLAIVGPGSVGTAGGSYYLGVWQVYPAWRVAIFLGLLPILILGGIALARRAPLAALATAALLPGTLAVTILVSRYSPGYAPRTVLAAVLGWALLVGAGAALPAPRWVTAVQGASFACLLAVSLGSVWTMHATGYRQHYRETVSGARAVAPTGYPIVPIGYLTAFFDAYDPDLAYTTRPALTNTLLKDPATNDRFWLVYGSDHSWENLPPLWNQLDALGYRRLLHQHFGDNLYLDLIARPGARFGAALPLPEGFPTGAGGWQLRGADVAVGGGGAGQELAVAGDGQGARGASFERPAVPGTLYVASVEARGAGASVSIACLSATGETLAISAEESVLPGVVSTPAADDWRPRQAAARCDAGTARVRVTLEQRAVGQARFRAAGLSAVELPTADGP